MNPSNLGEPLNISFRNYSQPVWLQPIYKQVEAEIPKNGARERADSLKTTIVKP